MKLTKSQKKEIARQMAQSLSKASHLYFTQYQGLKFVELAQLRARLKPLAAKYQVIKNSLVSHALQEAGIGGVEQGPLQGPIGLVVGQVPEARDGLQADPIAAARALMAFAKEFPLLKVKAGYVDSRWLKAEECHRLSTLGTKPELLSGLANALYGAVSRFAAVLQAPLRDLTLALRSVADQKGHIGDPQ